MKRSAQIIAFVSAKIGLWFNAIRAKNENNFEIPRQIFP